MAAFPTSTTSQLESTRSTDSCQNRCGEGFNAAFTCQCNAACVRHGDCCADYYAFLLNIFADLPLALHSCKGRCDESYNRDDPCHCNKCQQYNNCCNDYSALCDGLLWGRGLYFFLTTGGTSAGDHISNAEILELSEQFYSLDINKVDETNIVINAQRLIPNSDTDAKVDYAPARLYTFVNEGVFFARPTFAAFISLLNNYHQKTGEAEVFSNEQFAEQDTFLSEIMKTPIMQEFYNFLHSKSEIKKGKVSSFHNWIRFYLLEKSGSLNYYSHNFEGPWPGYPEMLGMQFNWNGYFKEVGSEFIGSSPEYDFAMYTLCFLAKPDKLCKVSVNGYQMGIQTYTWTKSVYGNGKKYVATAYPATP
ncbi:uridylate-specific endoribonuclease A [Latimeria chalumnae]|uniref:uridylate-specific endoribonuclease A n=1 Tax=Latimeria chalumnae TaxID=7897 RepID=UPI00313E5C2D